MSHHDIKQLEEREFNTTVEVIGQENLIVNMMSRLDVEEDAVPSQQIEEPRNIEHEIFRSVESLKLNEQIKGEWFTLEHLNELESIL